MVILDEKNYYPFGLQHRGYNIAKSPLGNATAKKFGFEGVELEESLSLDLFEMDWRQYDVSICRFISIDKLSEDAYDYTPFRFGFNNPIVFSDPSGLYEEIKGGYKTKNRDEIERLLGYLKDGSNDLSIDGINNFIKEDIAFTEEYEQGYILSGITVKGGKATKYSVHRTQNEIAYYQGYTNYLYNKDDYEMRNRILSGETNDPISRTLLAREQEGQYLPITAHNGNLYIGNSDAARMMNFWRFAELIGTADGAAKPFRMTRSPRYTPGIKPSGKTNSKTQKKLLLNAKGHSGPSFYKGMSFKEFHLQNSYLFKGKFRGRGSYMTHMSMTWRRLTK